MLDTSMGIEVVQGHLLVPVTPEKELGCEPWNLDAESGGQVVGVLDGLPQLLPNGALR